jgi:DNA replication protein DnaC
VQLLQKAKASYELPAVIKKLDRYSLLVIDDISFVRRNELETWVLFELICHRYERKFLLVTSNQPFREWDEIFPCGSMTVTAVDRMVHHCHIVGIRAIATGRREQLQGFWRCRRPAYVIDTGVMVVTINTSTAAARRR